MSEEKLNNGKDEAAAENATAIVPSTWQEQHKAREAEREEIRSRHRSIKEYEGVIYRDADPTPSVWDDGEKSVAVYTRVSTMSLNQTSSIENQELFYTDKVNKTENWELQEIYSDEGKSGTSTKRREAFLRMMADAKKGKFDLIICASVSRFARNVSDCMDYVADLRTMDPKHPIGVYFETENIFTLNPDADQTLGFHALLADWESGNKSRRMILSYDQRIFTNQFPVSDLLGFRHTKDGDLVIEPEEAKTVKYIFLSYISGQSCGEIAEKLTEMKRPTLKGRTDWNDAMVSSIMDNERRWGDLEARKNIVLDYKKKKVAKNTGQRKSAFVPNHHEGIVSRDIAMAAKYIRKSSAGLNGIPEMYVIDKGALKGFVSICPFWGGIDMEALRVACKSVYSEVELDELDFAESLRFGDERNKVLSMTFNGYQVPNSAYFIKPTLPALTFNIKGIGFNRACHKRLDDCSYVEVLYHPVFQTIALRPCDETAANAVMWKTETGNVKNTMAANAFSEAIYESMDWIEDYRFKFRGVSRERGDSKILMFELDEPQILVGKNKSSDTQYIAYRRESAGTKKPEEERGFIAYPIELAKGRVGISYELKQRLNRITSDITEEDINETGTAIEDATLGNIPSRQEILDEIDSLLESM